MALPMLYSRRKRLANKTGDDVYHYHEISSKLRQQMIFIFDDWDARYASFESLHPIYDEVVPLLREELGRVELYKGMGSGHGFEFRAWFLRETDIDSVLDAIELCVSAGKILSGQSTEPPQIFRKSVDVLNARMLEDGFGFQIENGQLIEIGSTFIHKDVTVPAIGLLADTAYEQANGEFRDAYREFNQGNYDDCIHDCCNAFESVLKVILTQKGWPFENKATANKLISIAFENELIPAYMQSQFDGLRSVLQSGVPTVRNKTAGAGHGAGTESRTIPKHIAAYQLHQTAAAIVLLVEASKA